MSVGNCSRMPIIGTVFFVLGNIVVPETLHRIVDHLFDCILSSEIIISFFFATSIRSSQKSMHKLEISIDHLINSISIQSKLQIKSADAHFDSEIFILSVCAQNPRNLPSNDLWKNDNFAKRAGSWHSTKIETIISIISIEIDVFRRVRFRNSYYLCNYC